MDILNDIVNIVQTLGYAGLFLMTLAEGTFIPIPNEVTLIPAGVLIARGDLSLAPTLTVSILGNLAGSIVSYYIAQNLGRNLVLKWGKYVGLNDKKMQKIENFFVRHGPASIFIGRIVPGIKHFISLPAGIANMNFKIFCMYSGAGGAIWVSILIIFGMIIGKNTDAIQDLAPIYMKKLTTYIGLFTIASIVIYIIIHLLKKRSARN